MQTKILSVLVAATAITCGARAQDTGIVTPSSPAPAVQQPQPAQVAATTAGAMPAPNQIIYAPRLPTAVELTSAAAAQGLAVDQISQTATQVTVVYRYSNGQTNTVAYQLLPTNTAPTQTTVAPTTVVVPAPAPTVVYETAPSVIYYERPYYYPRYYYPPVSVHLGFGYYRGWGGGGHHWR